MIHITPDKFKTMPWKNGKGVTEQIMSSCDHDDYDWRFSRADVSADGPFSVFPGCSRILTVIQGAGLSLVSNETSIDAAPFSPVGFSGETAIHGQLWDGPIKDLNLIYSTRRVNASAVAVEGQNTLELTPTDTQIYGIYCLSGELRCDCGLIIIPGDFMLVNDSHVHLSLNRSARILFYTLDIID